MKHDKSKDEKSYEGSDYHMLAKICFGTESYIEFKFN